MIMAKRGHTVVTSDADVPRLVKSHNIHLDGDYADWIAEVKLRYRSAQVKAAVKVNGEKLLFNWLLGRDLVQKKAEERWGSGVVEQVSLDLRREFPNADGFSTSNLWYMKKWYLFYTDQDALEKLQRLIGELQPSVNQRRQKLQQPIGEFLKQYDSEIIEKGGSPKTGGAFPLLFALVPWGQHIEIITRSESVEEAFFYLHQVIEKSLSRPALINCYKAHLYEHQGKIVNNFSERLPDLQSKLVREVLKENYDFGFATVEHELYDEDELESALTKNITDMLLEMGTGFAFLGSQKQLVVGGRTRKIDLLFYHIRLRCYVVCELKAKPFEPEFAGKLNYYVNAVDELLKTEDENPTIGLLICSDMNKTDVQWSFKGIDAPLGVATYNNIRIKDMLPTQEQLKERMELLQKEMRKTKKLLSQNK